MEAVRMTPVQTLCGLPKGARLREFEILSVLGGGKTSLVYRAQDHNLGRPAAIKEYLPAGIAYRHAHAQVEVPPDRSEAFAHGLKRFFTEGQNMTKFRHPVFREALQLFTENGTAYIVMPYHDGRTLREMVRDDWSVADIGSLLSIILPLLTGLSMLHQAGYYHCDISADNVLIRDDGAPVLLDFGAMRRKDSTAEERPITELAPGFAAKEQYEENGEIGAVTDIYALSALAYYIVTGIIPDLSFSRVAHDLLKPLASFATPELPAEVLGVIDRGLAPGPQARFRDIASFVKALEIATQHAMLQSGGPLAREMMSIDAAASSFSTKQRGLLQSIWGLREHLGLSGGETRP
jgi:serine/threonine protein kinase